MRLIFNFHKSIEISKIFLLFITAINNTIKNLLFFVLLFVKSVLVGQPNMEADILNLLERFELHTDRNIYTIGESIHFVAFDVSGLNKSEPTLSKVLNAEIISFDGTVMNQQKFPLYMAKTSGVISIPDGVQSGVYFLRIYTRFMRNYGPLYYAYVPITILNYKTNEILQEPLNYLPDFYIDTLGKKEIDQEHIGLQFQSIIRRESQSLNILVSVETQFIGGIVSVVPEALYMSSSIKVVSKKSPKEVKFQFAPETRGVTLSGILIDNQSNLSVSYQEVDLSLMEEPRFSLVVLSDSLGKFFFSFPPAKGKKELLVTSPYRNNLSINVDNDFCTEPIQLPFVPLLLYRDTTQAIVNLIKRSVINQQFNSKKTDSLNIVSQNSEIFYEKPSQSIVLSDYIVLPTLNDYFYELLTLAAVRKKNGYSYLQVFGDASELHIYPPLVLIDNIIVTEIDKLLAISPKLIDRIEVLNKPYIKGDLTYGGIVNIFSKNGDLANMELPKSGQFFNYQLFSDQQPFDYCQEIPDNEPIIRNTLYWNVFDSIPTNGLEFEFNVGDVPGKYMVQLYGITPEGTVVKDTASFIVK